MRILLGVTGCIAAYKACEILRGLQNGGADVEVVMTKSATEFVTQTTFSALSRHPARVHMFGDQEDAIPHIRMASECDLLLIAPCTANVLAKIANGIADDLLTSTALAAHSHLAVAPAMNVHMYESPATQDNLKLLKERGVAVIEPGSGYLACGETGKGRLADPEEIVQAALALVKGDGAVGEGAASKKDLAGKKVLVTAGPTVERIDAVRYITNDSSGKMGYALAEAAKARGAEVTLVAGPVALSDPAGVEVVHVRSAIDMLDAARKPFEEADIAVFAAAVADMRPKTQYPSKLKKGKDEKRLKKLELVENPDVIFELQKGAKSGQYVIAFAAETEDLVKNARRKLQTKGADMVVANEVGDGKAFGTDENKAVLVTADSEKDIPNMSKFQLANEIFDEACANIA